MPLPKLALSVAASHHLLVLGDNVESAEVPALLRSLVTTADWTHVPTDDFPGVLDLLATEESGSPDVPDTPRATITGPWRIDVRARHDLALPAWVTTAWVLDVEPERSEAAPDFPGGHGELLDAFGPFHPIGLERSALDAVYACARRLGGALRTDQGVLLEVDPASAVDLVVFAPTWLQPAALGEVLADALPLLQLMPGVEKDQADELDGYGGIAFVGPEGDVDFAVVVEVAAAEVLPPALAGLGWTEDGVITYQLRWTAIGPLRIPTTRAEVRRRDAVRAAIERSALALHAAVGGEILDEDQLPVLPEQLGG